MDLEWRALCKRINFLTGALWTWDQVKQMGGGWPTIIIQLDISKGTGLSEGKDKTYTESNGNKVKVTKGPAVSGFDFYIHTLADGGPFTLKKDIKYSATDTAPLQGVINSISDVYEVYYYVKTSENKGALKIKTSSDTKIFYKTNVGDNTEWTNQETTAATGDLEALVTEIKDHVEIKLDNCGDSYTSRPTDNHQVVIVSPLAPNGNFKGFRHTVTGAINRVTIWNKVITQIGTADLASKRFVYVYFKIDDTTYQKPLLICLSQDGEATGNTWYERKNNGGNYTWELQTSDYSSISPGGTQNQIDGDLKDKLQGIVITGDPGYTKPDLVIKLDYTPKDNTAPIKYRSGDVQVTVERLTDNSGFKGYKHDLTNPVNINMVKIHGNDINGIQPNDLRDKRFVFVYFKDADTKREKPLLICLSQDGNKGSGNLWYSRTKSSPNTWADANTGSGYNQIDPNSITALEEKLDGIKEALALTTDEGYTSTEPNVIIDASVTPDQEDETKGALYGIGDKQIKVERKVGGASQNPVPENYIRYKHTTGGTFTLGLVKHNGQELEGIVTEPGGTSNVTAVYVYYSTSDSTHQFPLIVCVKTSDSGNPQKYYTRGQTWTSNNNQLNNVDPESRDAGRAQGELEKELDKLITQYEVKLERTNTGGTYTGSFSGKQIDVQPPDSTNLTGYNGYKHVIENNLKIERVTYFSSPVRGIGNLDKGTTIDSVTNFWVFYEENDAGRTKPLILCYNSGSVHWYHRGVKWNEASELNQINVPTANLTELDAANKAKVTSKLEMMSRQGTFKELIYGLW